MPFILKEFDGGKSAQEIQREHGVSKASLYKWRQRYGGGMEATELKRVTITTYRQIGSIRGIYTTPKPVNADVSEVQLGLSTPPGTVQKVERRDLGIQDLVSRIAASLHIL